MLEYLAEKQNKYKKKGALILVFENSMPIDSREPQAYPERRRQNNARV